MIKAPRRISASELATYSYCERAWGYEQSGLSSANIPALKRGSQVHLRHSRMVRLSRSLAAGAWMLLAAGAILILLWLF